ncbi:MAG: hypothetical protein U0R52_08220 [Solirubrobacterales bacterium]
MARGRGKPTFACAYGATALAATALAVLLGGCGAKEHANEPRPALATQVSVAIGPDKVTTSPRVVGVTPPRLRARADQQGVAQDTPLLVWFTIANLTDFDSHLEIRGARRSTSPLVVGNGNADYKAYLPTGEYLLSAADIPGAVAARFTVGPDRVSSSNDLNIP